MGRKFAVTLSVPEIQQSISQISSYDGRARMRIENAVKESTKAIERGSRQRVPVRSGNLKKSIKRSFSTQKVEGIVRAREPYAHLVEFGHKGAVVKPKDKRALNLGGGNFAEQVKLPDVAGRPFLRPSFEDEKPHLISELAKAVQP